MHTSQSFRPCIKQAQAIRQEAHDYVIRMLEQAVLARQRMFGASSEQ